MTLQAIDRLARMQTSLLNASCAVNVDKIGKLQTALWQSGGLLECLIYLMMPCRAVQQAVYRRVVILDSKCNSLIWLWCKAPQ